MADGNAHAHGAQERIVEVDEPGLSPDANRRLTEEARAVLGTDRVRVPADRPDPAHDAPLTRSPLAALLAGNQITLGMCAASAVVVGLIIALVTNTWWLLPVAVIVLGLATFLVVRMVLSLTAAQERPSPETVALMEEEGVDHPERMFSAVVAEFAQDADASGGEERTVDDTSDPAAADAEQRSAVTPTGGPSHAVGPVPPPNR